MTQYDQANQAIAASVFFDRKKLTREHKSSLIAEMSEREQFRRGTDNARAHRRQKAKQPTYNAGEDRSVYGIDLFLRCLYEYWLNGGIDYIIARKLTRLVKSITLFTIVFVLVYCVDYAALSQLAQSSALSTESLDTARAGNQTATSGVSVATTSTVAESVQIVHSPHWTWFSVLWLLGCIIYIVYNSWKTFNELHQAYNIRRFYRQQLNVPTDEQLYWMPWKQVCKRLREFQYKRWRLENAESLRDARPAAAAGAAAAATRQQRQQQGGLFVETEREEHTVNTGVGSCGTDSDDSAAATNERLVYAMFEDEAMLTDDNIASMIMRRENYWIALFADNLLAFDSHLPGAAYERPEQDDVESSLPKSVVYDLGNGSLGAAYMREQSRNGHGGVSHRPSGDANYNHDNNDNDNDADYNNDDDDDDIEAFGHLERRAEQCRTPVGSRKLWPDAEYSDSDRTIDFSSTEESESESPADEFAHLLPDEPPSIPTSFRRRENAWMPGSTPSQRARRRRRNNSAVFATMVSAVQPLLTAAGSHILKPLFITECDPLRDDSAVNSTQIMEKPILTQTLQWCLTYGLFGFAIDSHSGALKHDLTVFVESNNTYAEREKKRTEQSRMYKYASEWHRANVSQPLTMRLMWRFRTMALVGALLSPFIFVLVILSFFFEYGDEVRRAPGQSLGARQWTNEARWEFRRYNELPHSYESRLERASLAAKQYVDLFLFATLGEYARCVAFVLAATLFVFVVFGVVGDEEALALAHFALGRSALWWMTALSIMIAAARSLVPTADAIRRETLRRHDGPCAVCRAGCRDADNDRSENLCTAAAASAVDNVKSAVQMRCDMCSKSPQELCRLVAQHTGYYPRSWKGAEHTDEVRARFFCLYESKWLIYLREILGILYTPYLLWFVFPDKAQQFLDFFVERTELQRKVGHACARENTDAINVSEMAS